MTQAPSDYNCPWMMLHFYLTLIYTAVIGSPVNPTFTELNTSTITLTWGAPTTSVTVTGYSVQYSIVSSASGTAIEGFQVVGPGELEWQITLSEQQTYDINATVWSLSETSASAGVTVRPSGCKMC